MKEPAEASQKRISGFLSFPSTGVGKWSARLLLVSILLILIYNLVVMPWTELEPTLELVQKVFNLTLFLCIVFTCVAGRFAIVIKRERSWILFVTVLLLALAIAFDLGYLFQSLGSVLGYGSTTPPSLEPITPHEVAADARPVVIDTDMAADDWMAILFLLGRPDVEVLAISLCWVH